MCVYIYTLCILHITHTKSQKHYKCFTVEELFVKVSCITIRHHHYYLFVSILCPGTQIPNKKKYQVNLQKV